MKKTIIITTLLTAAFMQSWAQTVITPENMANYTSFNSRAGGYTVDNVTYIPSYSGTATVGKSVQAIGNVVIPEKVKINGKEYKVTAIAENAFRDNNNIKSVTLPNTIQEIGKGAFWRCKNLTKTNIPANVTEVGSQAYQQSGLAADPNGLLYIDNWLVGYGYVDDAASGGKKIKKPEGEVIIKAGTRGIARGCFDFCSRMTSVFIPASVKNIGFPLFKYCNELSAIVVEEGNRTYDSRNDCNAIVYKRADGLMAGCKGTVIPNNVKAIYPSAFEGCEALSSIVIPDSVNYIEEKAFKGCVKLTLFSFPKMLKTVVGDAFNGTGWYKAQPDGLLYKDGWLLGYKGEKPAGKVEIQAATKRAASQAFLKCEDIKEVVLPDGLEEISVSMFYGCTGLKSINIPQSVKEIGYAAFCNCSSLKALTIPEGVTTIGDAAFWNCTNLKTINIPNSVNNVIFSSFQGTGWFSKQSDGALYLNNWLLGWKGKRPTNKVVIKEGTTHISKRAFANCAEMKTVVFPESLKTIGDYAFTGCEKLVTADLPNGLEEIGMMAFFKCLEFKPERIPESVTKLYDSSFANTGWYNSQPADEILYLDNWLMFGTKSHRVIGELDIRPGTRGIAAFAFSGAEKMTSVTIPPSLKYVGKSAFNECTSLMEVNISDLEAWKQIKFENETSNPTHFSNSLTLNGETITEW